MEQRSGKTIDSTEPERRPRAIKSIRPWIRGAWARVCVPCLCVLRMRTKGGYANANGDGRASMRVRGSGKVVHVSTCAHTRCVCFRFAYTIEPVRYRLFEITRCFKVSSHAMRCAVCLGQSLRSRIRNIRVVLFDIHARKAMRCCNGRC